jgi:hypothetical protein
VESFTTMSEGLRKVVSLVAFLVIMAVADHCRYL